MITNEVIGADCWVKYDYQDKPTYEYVSFGFSPNMDGHDKYGIPVDAIWMFMDSEDEIILHTDEVLMKDGVYSYYIMSYELRYLGI